MATKSQKAINRGAARFIPLLLIAIVSYSSWVVVNLCVRYLFTPNADHRVQPRHGAGIAIIVVYFTLLLPMALTYLRLLQVITTDPGYIPLGSGAAESKQSKAPKEEHTITASCAPTTITVTEKAQAHEDKERASGSSRVPNQPYDGLDRKGICGRRTMPPAGLEKFYTKDVFVCEMDGLPRWCSICCNWKPDRAHHCSEIDRCVIKMDHYCPWVGGIISETSYKFFIQFVSYGALYCIYTLVIIAYFVAEAKRLTGSVNTHWAVVLGFAAMFSLFSIGMALTTIQLALINCTTIENLSRTSRIYNLAILINEGGRPGNSPLPPPPVGSFEPAAVNEPGPYFRTITYPLPSPQQQDPDSALRPTPNNSRSPRDARKTPLRTFAIFETLPGENPWDIGRLGNFKQVMGYHWYDWFLPVRRSPCCDHSSGESMYALNAAVIERIKRDAGLLAPRSRAGSGTQGSEEHRKRKRSGSYAGAHRSARRQNISRLRNIEESDEKRRRRTRKRRRRSEQDAVR